MQLILQEVLGEVIHAEEDWKHWTPEDPVEYSLLSLSLEAT